MISTPTPLTNENHNKLFWGLITFSRLILGCKRSKQDLLGDLKSSIYVLYLTVKKISYKEILAFKILLKFLKGIKTGKEAAY